MRRPFGQKAFLLAGLLACLLAVLAAPALTPSPALAAPGDLVPAFDGDGVITFNPSTTSGAYTEAIHDIAIDSSGSVMYIVGTVLTAPSQWRIEKRQLDTGALITTFDGDGVVTSNVSPSGRYGGDPDAIAIDVAGNAMYVVGYDRLSGDINDSNQWRIEKRRLDTGALITTFDGDGIVQSNPTVGAERFSDIAIDTSANAMYVAGSGWSGSSTFWSIQKRRLDNGALCTAANCGIAFDTDGEVIIDPGTDSDTASAVAIDTSANAMYVVGGQSSAGGGSSWWRIEKRRLDTGALITTFDGDGVVNPGTGDWAYDIAIDPSGNALYVVGSAEVVAEAYSQWRIEKRRLDTGALITTFDGDGVVLSNLGTNIPDIARALVIDTANNEMYAAGYSSVSLSDSQWHIEKRQLDTGALITNFGTNGVVTNSPSTSADSAESIAVDSNGIYIVGHDSYNSTQGEHEWRIEKRESGAPPPPPPPTVNLWATPATIDTGQSSTVSWTSTDATSCAAVSPAGWTSSTATSGAETVWPAATTTYIIECTGPGGTTQQSTTVTVNATCGEGTPIWAQTYNSGGTQFDTGRDVTVDSGGNIYVAGSQATNGTDIFLRKYDSSGNFQWMQTYNSGGTQSDSGEGVAVDSSGNIYISGKKTMIWDTVILLKYDSTGNFQWEQDYIGGDFRDGSGVAVDLSGNIYVTGYQGTNGNDMFLRKYDSSGNFQWMQTYNSGGTQLDEGKDVTVDLSGNIYVAGTWTTGGDTNIFLRKYDSSGNFQWMQTYDSGGTQNDGGNDVTVDSSGSIYVAGFQGTNGNDMLLRKYDSSGNFQWMQTYNSGGGQQDSGLGVAVDSGGNIYVAGSQETNGADIFLRKYDSAGAFQWMQTYNSTGTQTDYGFGVAVDSANNINVVGRQPTNSSDAVLLQYDGSGCGFTPAPTVTLDAVPSTINSGDSSTLTWTSTDAASCAAVSPAGWTAKTTVNDSQLVTNITATTTYIIACTGPGGTAQQSTTVTVSGGGGGGCGQQIYDGTTTITLSCEDPPVSPLRTGKDATTYGIQLVDPSDPNASKVRIQTPSGVKALRKQ